MSPVTGSLLLLILCYVGSSAIDAATTEPPKSELKPGPGVILPIEKLGACPADVDYPTCDTPGVNKTADCASDKYCEGKRKCCFSGCKLRCLLPVEPKMNSCPYFNHSICIYARPAPPNCQRDEQCQGTERCCCFNCGRQCTPTVKPGQCPVKKVYKELLLRPRCQTDNDCDGKEKCCGKKCVAPQIEHAGVCRSSLDNLACITLKKSLCNSDSDCPKKQKCCLSGDVQKCSDSLKEKPGSCPVPITRCMAPPTPRAPPICNDDSGCPGNKKCCVRVCEPECIDPIRSTPLD
ncbi:uncharacterized protein LOC142143310 [Mixophyes fleayi]|uniref:uncharacterized protein LOC142143310 n=1 Tax=Mixophyes fleayi TaxID=3061075 RepID=UPI003F4DFA50